MHTHKKILPSSPFLVSPPAGARTLHPALRGSARVRLFGRSGRPSSLLVQTDQGAERRLHVGGGSWAGLLGRVKNQGIGMAPTVNTRHLKHGNGLFSKAYYREFLIPAGKPVQIENTFAAMGSSGPASFAGVQLIFQQGNAGGQAASFVPQGGKDYEVGVYGNAGVCTVVVYEVDTSGGETRLLPVAIDY